MSPPTRQVVTIDTDVLEHRWLAQLRPAAPGDSLEVENPDFEA